MMRAFSDEEMSLVRDIQRSEIRVDHEGKLKIWFAWSPEYAAAELHKLCQSKGDDDAL